MNALDTLRKQYANLTAFERAVMRSRAVETNNTDLVEALCSPNVHIAFNCTANELTFSWLAFAAVYESLRAEVKYWMSVSIVNAIERGEAIQGKADPKNDNSLDKWHDRMDEAKRSRTAWMLALEALDAETGAACMSLARTISGGHCAIVAEDTAGKSVEHTGELNYLRRMWNGIMRHRSNVPTAQEPSDAEDDDDEDDEVEHSGFVSGSANVVIYKPDNGRG